MKLGRLILRAVVGGFFVGHGTQKLFGWFGGHGLDGTSQMFESLGLRPGKAHAAAAGAAETSGGAMLVAGAATPLAASILIATMLTAINRVHVKNGPWATNGGYEYNVVLIAAALALAETGPGAPSVDVASGSEMYGPLWALLALAGGVAGAAGAHLIAERGTSPAEPAPPAGTPASSAPAPAPEPIAAAPNAPDAPPQTPEPPAPAPNA
ncbi:MAG: DoxX family protein [Solirubrobacterales bacterium]|nr:DoxX family protein [Solirubrobacterales bacterium]